MVRFSTKLAGALLGLAAGLLTVPWAAQAAPSVGVDDVVAALGLGSEPADYVVLVDTSGSMNQGGRYGAVRLKLRTLLDGLEADDRVSLLTFDSSARFRFRGVVGESPGAILAKLPATAGGDHTDIGAAIAAGLTELERADTHRLAALILITDGVLDTRPGSAYADVDSNAWKRLSSRAADLAKDHELAAYAVSLLAKTDAALLKKVLPQATEVSATEVGDRFAEVGGDLVRLQAAKALEHELAVPVQVNWTGDLGAALAGNAPVPVNLEFISPYTHVPIELQDLQAQGPAGLSVVLSGLPEKVTLEPGARVTVAAQATVTGSAGSGADVGLTATVTSPWRKVLEEDLGLEFAPVLEGSAKVAPPPLELPPTLAPTLVAIVALVALGAGVLLIGSMLLTPRVDGLLEFSRSGRPVADVVVNGRRMKLVAPAGAVELAELRGVISGARGSSRAQRAVRINAQLGADRAKGLVADGDVILLGDIEIAYVSGRRRILEKIGLPLEGRTGVTLPEMSP